MKIVKMILKNFIILLVSIIAAGTIIIASCTNIVFNKEEVKKTINKSGIYTKMSDEARKIAIEALNEALKEVDSSYGITIDAKDLIGNIDISDMFELVANEIIDLAYSKDEPKLAINYLTSRYLDKLDEYLEKNKIVLPKEIDKTIHDSLSEESLNKLIDDSEVSKALVEVQKAHIKIEDMANTIVLILLIVIAVPTILILILCKKKIKELIKILVLTILITIGIEIFVRSGISSVSNEAGELVMSLLNSSMNLLFNKVHMVLVGIGVVLFIIATIKILSYKSPEEKAEAEKEKEEKEERYRKENAKIKEDGTVVSAFDKF